MPKMTRRRFIQGTVGGGLIVMLPLQGVGRVRTGAQLEDIYEPQVVGIPPVNAFNGLVRMPNGEIRHYGQQMYLVSRDDGLTWTEKKMSETELMEGQGRPMSQHPQSGTWLRVTGGDRLSVRRWADGLRGASDHIELAEEQYIMLRPAYYMKSRDRILVTGHSPVRPYRIGVFWSDDDGRFWEQTLLKPGPAFEVHPPHAQPRWENWSCEPTIVELKDGRLWMIARTSRDWHYQCFSEDGGASWSDWERSPFYGTITMPTLFRMRDGRLLFLWCNTTPLAEADRSGEGIPQSMQDGTWEDVFTNRDALHAAVSHDDGQTWRGFREIRLNPLRNDSDLAEKADHDLSVHQPQCVELEGGKVLVACGQDPEVRRMLIFDPDWLMEPGRECVFDNGLEDWSTHQYIAGIRGHCAYNRKPGPGLIDHPDEPGKRVLRLRRIRDESLVHDMEGATWNFPAMTSGRLTIRVMVRNGAAGLRIGLIDRWINPADPYMPDYANYLLEIDGKGRIAGSQVMEPGQWHTLELRWTDAGSGLCHVAVDGHEIGDGLPVQVDSLHGVSYVHLQNTAEAEDKTGVLVDWVKADGR